MVLRNLMSYSLRNWTQVPVHAKNVLYPFHQWNFLPNVCSILFIGRKRIGLTRAWLLVGCIVSMQRRPEKRRVQIRPVGDA